jgi:lipase
VDYQTFDVPVAGGKLHVGRWGAGSFLVIAAHGLTATHAHFHALADQLGHEVTLLAPDLRGRGRSSELGGPYGMASHADDLLAILDHVGAAAAVALGHSMGGFVAAVAADRHPERFPAVILVDGGLPFDLGPLASAPSEQVIRAMTGPALDRLRMTFPSPAAHLDYWRSHPALANDWNAYIERACGYDLVGEPPELRSSVSEKAVLEDADSELRSGDVMGALRRLTQPVVLARAPRGIFNQEPPLYPNAVAEAGRALTPQLTDVVIPDVNHYTILLTERGAKAVAEIVGTRQPRGHQPL